MGLFSTPPKRITQREYEGTFFKPGFLGSVHGNGSMEKIPDRHLPVLKAIMDNAINDVDHYRGGNFKGITAEKIPGIRKEMEETGQFNSKQIDHVESELKKRL